MCEWSPSRFNCFAPPPQEKISVSTGSVRTFSRREKYLASDGIRTPGLVSLYQITIVTELSPLLVCLKNTQKFHRLGRQIDHSPAFGTAAKNEGEGAYLCPLHVPLGRVQGQLYGTSVWRLGRIHLIACRAIVFVWSVRLSVRNCHRVSHRTNFREIWWLGIFTKICRGTPDSVKWGKNVGHLTGRGQNVVLLPAM